MGLAVSKALIQAAPRLSLLPSEILNVIAEFLDDVLIPRHLGSLACSCKVINAAVKDALDKLKVEYDAASALLVKCVHDGRDCGASQPGCSRLGQQRFDRMQKRQFSPRAQE